MAGHMIRDGSRGQKGGDHPPVGCQRYHHEASGI